MTNTVSQAGAPLPMIRALVETRNTPLGDIQEWIAQNDTQREFLTNYYNPGREESTGIEEMEAVASDTAAVVNQFLQERGFSISLQELGPDEYGMAAVLDYPWKWLDQDGEDIQMQAANGQYYPAAQLKRGVSFHTTPESQVLVRLETQTADVIWMSMEENPAKDYALVSQVQKLQQNARPATLKTDQDRAITAVEFPQVDLDLETQVDWILGMRAVNPEGRRVVITQAAQQTKLKMNHTGGRCKSAAAVAASFECLHIPPPSFKIDKPFLIWCERPGLSQPLFALHLCPDVWKTPADLD